MILSEMYKKLLTSALLVCVLTISLALPHAASAQEWWAPTHAEFNARVNDTGIPDNEIFGERYTHAQVWWVVYSLINLAFGTSTMECASDGSNAGGGSDGAEAYVDCLQDAGVPNPDISSRQQTQSVAVTSGQQDWGILSLAMLSDQMLSTKPASGVAYVSNVAKNILGIPEAQAQEAGFGFNSLQPLQSIWVVSRNAAYSLMTFAVVILAFMVMFRAKISPQASVTVQSAIPRIIIGLLLITFSFAIAGFIIDLAYVVQGIISTLVAGSALTSSNDPIGLFNRINDVTTGVMSYGFLVIGVAVAIAVGITILTGGPAVLAGVIVIIVVLVLFLIALLKIFWMLLRTYVMIIFHIVALPFAALGYVASPSSNPFMSLLKSLIGHVSVFVTLSVVVMFAHLVAWNMAAGSISSTNPALGGWGIFSTMGMLNPYGANIGTWTGTLGLPAFGGTDTSSIALFIGLVILLMASSVANNIRSLITTGRPAREGFNIMGAGAAAAVGGMVGGAVGKGVSTVGGAAVMGKIGQIVPGLKVGETGGGGGGTAPRR